MPQKTSAPLFRPKSLIRTARIGARLYRRERDLAAALPGRVVQAASAIIAQLQFAEQQCESLRRGRSPAYKPARHVQVLAALLAESKQAIAP
ncbi:MAG: DUF6477 family protein [Paracoccaceae bacterium]|nr:DUF6477 family protein [Paracoccaceae bacterium]